MGPTGPTGPSAPLRPGEPMRLLDGRICGWLEPNRDRLNQLIAERGYASETFDASHRPVAIFDWDNTMMKNDIGDGTLFWMINNDKILQPEDRDWSKSSTALTVDARAALNAACDDLADPGEPLPTSTSTTCATTIVKIYDEQKTPAGTAAFSAATTTNNPPYTWAVQLLAGYRPDEARGFAMAAYEENAYAPIGSRQLVGSMSMNGYVRIYEQMEDLARTLSANGFDVWVLSASQQNLVEVVASIVGVDRHHVIGVRNVVVNGRLTADIQGCGSVADGENTMITFDEGKRCWINKVIFDEPAATQMVTNSDPSKRPVFVAGDSDTDIAMLKDATDLKLVLNRGKIQTVCNAYANAGGKWIVQPMFIEPRPQRSTPYACTTALDANGAPIVDENGAAFTSDQADAVFALPTCN